jgi:hypothetical protein
VAGAFGERVDTRLLDAGDPAARDLVALLLDGQADGQPALAVAVNGVCAGTPPEAESLLACLGDLLA